MARATTIYTNFTGGKLSDSMDGRVDTAIYQNGAKELENFLITTQGSAKRRQGTRFVYETKDSSVESRLIPFKFSASQNYVLEFGDEYIRFYKDGGIIESGGSPYEIATPYSTSDLSNIRFAQNKDILYLIDGTNSIRKLLRYSDTSWSLSEVSISNTPMLDINTNYGGGEVIGNGSFTSVLSPWTDESSGSSAATISSDTLDLTVVGTDDAIARQTLTITEPSVAHTLSIDLDSGSDAYVRIGTAAGASDILTDTLLSAGTNSISVSAPGVSTAYIDLYKLGSAGSGTAILDDCSLASSAEYLKLTSTGSYGAGQSMTMTATNHTPFESGHVGSTWELVKDPTASTVVSVRVEVIAYISSTQVTVQPLTNVPSTLQNINTYYWKEGAWSDVQGYPKVIALFEQRLIFANTDNNPQTIWFSVSGVYEDFDVGEANDDDGFNRTIASKQLNTIQWIEEVSDVLAVGTTGGEFIVTGGGDNNALTPTNIAIRRQSNYGCEFIDPVNQEGALLFAQINARILRILGYNLETDGYLGDDATIYSEDILSTGIKYMDFQKQKNRILWCVLNDGNIAALTYEPIQKVQAWSEQTTDGSFESIAVINGDDADEVWVIVNRIIDGVTKRYVEYFEPQTSDDFMVDCGLEYSGVATTAISGLDHLAGEEVDIWNNGAYETPKTVSSSGTLTLDSETTNAIIGLNYTSKLRTIRAEVASRNGPAQGKPKTIYRMIIRFLNTGGSEYSTDGTNYYKFEWRTTDDYMDTAIPLYSGDVEIIAPLGWNDKGDLYIRQTYPLPITIQLIHLMVSTNDL